MASVPKDAVRESGNILFAILEDAQHPMCIYYRANTLDGRVKNTSIALHILILRQAMKLSTPSQYTRYTVTDLDPCGPHNSSGRTSA
ncbi:hypothetical protein V8E36_004054 [Tilletia maclaganii]